MQNHATSMKRVGKIHFVHHLEKLYAAPNLGDWIASPYYYFTDFFSRYTCVLHSDWSVLWHEIERDDIVIFGGGGLLDNSDALNVVLNRLIDKCDNVIVWGAGTKPCWCSSSRWVRWRWPDRAGPIRHMPLPGPCRSTFRHRSPCHAIGPLAVR